MDLLLLGVIPQNTKRNKKRGFYVSGVRVEAFPNKGTKEEAITS